jgi:hypothetical protein
MGRHSVSLRGLGPDLLHTFHCTPDFLAKFDTDEDLGLLAEGAPALSPAGVREYLSSLEPLRRSNEDLQFRWTQHSDPLLRKAAAGAVPAGVISGLWSGHCSELAPRA